MDGGGGFALAAWDPLAAGQATLGALALGYLVSGKSIIAVGLHSAMPWQGDTICVSALLDPVPPLALNCFAISISAVWIMHRQPQAGVKTTYMNIERPEANETARDRFERIHDDIRMRICLLHYLDEFPAHAVG